MARDPVIQHDDVALREGLRLAAAGDLLADREPVRDELLHLGLLRRGDDELLLTPEGRRFLE